MKNKTKKLMSLLLIVCAIIALAPPMRASAAKLNKTKKTLSVGQSFSLKLTGTFERARWSSSKSSVASVDQTGKVTAKKHGSAIITAEVSGKTLKCKIKVKKSNIKPRTIYKDENIIVKLKGISEPGSFGGYDIEFEIENLTGDSILVQNRETSINGYMTTYAAMSETISSGKKSIAKLIVFGDDAENTPASKIKSMETKLSISKEDDIFDSYETEIFTVI